MSVLFQGGATYTQGAAAYTQSAVAYMVSAAAYMVGEAAYMVKVRMKLTQLPTNLKLKLNLSLAILDDLTAYFLHLFFLPYKFCAAN